MGYAITRIACRVGNRIRHGQMLMILACLVCLGCSDLTGPDLPDEDTSLDPARLAVGVEYYHCGHWDSRVGRPTTDHVLIDVFFTGEPDDQFLDHPRIAHRTILKFMRATIIRTYHLPGFRVWMPTDSVSPLSGRFGVIIRSVPDPSRYDLEVYADYGAHNFGTADSARIGALGGVVVNNYENIGLVDLKIPERSVGSVRADPRVQWVEAVPDFLCTAPTAGSPGEIPTSPINSPIH